MVCIAVVVPVMPDEFCPVALPFRMQLLMVTTSVLVTSVECAKRITDVYVVAAAAALVIVKSRSLAPPPGASPLIVTLSAPFNSMMPLPLTEVPVIVIPGAAGLIVTLV